MPNDKAMLCLGELHEEYGIDPRTARRLAREEGLPLYQIGGRVCVLVEELLAWIKAHPKYTVSDAALDERIERSLG